MENGQVNQQLQKRIADLEQELAAKQKDCAELKEKLDRFSSLVEDANDLIHSVTPEGKFIYANQAWLDTLGYRKEDLQNLSLIDIIDKEFRDKCTAVFRRLLVGENPGSTETVFHTKDGRKVSVEGRCKTKFKDGKAVAMNGIFRDITERLKNEQALRESEKRYRDLFENASDLIQIVRPDGRLLYVNKAWKDTFGFSDDEISTLSLFDIISPDCQGHCSEVFEKVMSEEKVHQIETVFVAKDGRKVDIEGSAICKFQDGSPVSSQCIFRDVSYKKRVEEEMQRAQKLESVGVLAGGIAHDFNNLLTGILGNISMAKISLNPGEALYDHLDETEKAAMRAKGLTQQLLTFAKGGAPVKKVAVINGIVQDSASFTLRGASTACEYYLAEDLWPIEVDEGQLGQVVQNLVINAKQAMPDGGVVTVRTRNHEVAEGDLLPLPPGRYVHLSVEDRGTGISKENRERIFDPYFSNKQTGCGLGLAIAYAIVKKHNGVIAVDSEVGKGSTFSLYFPATDAAPAKGKKEEAPAGKVNARVLVVDDEELVRTVATSLLAHIGCSVETVMDGQEAIEVYRKAMEAGSPFDVVIMDLTIPGGMGGKEAVKRLMEFDPKVKALVSSGYATDPVMAHYRDYGFAGVIPKPFRLSELGEVLSQVLG